MFCFWNSKASIGDCRCLVEMCCHFELSLKQLFGGFEEMNASDVRSSTGVGELEKGLVWRREGLKGRSTRITLWENEQE